MSKRFTKLIAAFAATMTMLPASAQVMPENQVPLIPSRILPGQKTAQQKVDPLKAFPTLLRRRCHEMSNRRSAVRRLPSALQI
ncbi:hypothetical protein [Prevotella denticola]|uniref:hypothetical protein n=1 Tax=Prevotella denticola TaxID=28129 RepID=UPI002150E5C7|nr:hypothetical protein [Prevotella denticola]